MKLDRSAQSYLAMVYSIEGIAGSNNWYQFLAVFLVENQTVQFITSRKVGGHAIRGIDNCEISNRRLMLKTMEYTPQDAACCPSAPGKMEFRLKGKRLVRIK